MQLRGFVGQTTKRGGNGVKLNLFHNWNRVRSYMVFVDHVIRSEHAERELLADELARANDDILIRIPEYILLP